MRVTNRNLQLVFTAITIAGFLCCSALAGAEKKETDAGMKVFSYIGIDGKSYDMAAYFPKGHSRTDKGACFIFFHGEGWYPPTFLLVDRFLRDQGLLQGEPTLKLGPENGKILPWDVL